MPIQLSPDQEAVVNDILAGGKYDSAEEILNAAIQRFAIEQIPASEIKAMVAIGRADIEAGRTFTLKEVCDRLGIPEEADE